MNRRGVVALVGTICVAGGALFVAFSPTPIETVVAKSGVVVQTVVASGSVMPPAEIKIGAMVSSTAQDVYLQEGDLVEAGQVLVQLDDSAARASLAQADAALAAAKAGRTSLDRLDAPSAEAALRQAQAQYSQAKLRLSREKQLFDGGVTTQSALDDAQTAYDVAEAQKQASMLRVKAASSGGSQSLNVAASIAQAQAQRTLSEVQVARHRILAPASGILLSRAVEPGDAIATGTTLFVLSSTGATRLRIEPDERNLSLLKLGQPAIASSEAFPLLKFQAAVQFIAPAVNPQRGTVEVRLSVSDPPQSLRPHMTVSVEIETARAQSALSLPRTAIIDESTKPFVFEVIGGRLKKQPITLGLRGDSLVQIVDGARSGASYVKNPSVELSEGQRVSPLAAGH